MLGALKPGTVGRIASGRLVLVESVDQFASHLVSLPDQPSSAFTNTWDGRFSGNFKGSPFTSVDPVPFEELSERNQHFLKTGVVLPAEVEAPVVKVRKRQQTTNEFFQQQMQRVDAIVSGEPGVHIFKWEWKSPANGMSRYSSQTMSGRVYLDALVYDGKHPETVKVRVK